MRYFEFNTSVGSNCFNASHQFNFDLFEFDMINMIFLSFQFCNRFLKTEQCCTCMDLRTAGILWGFFGLITGASGFLAFMTKANDLQKTDVIPWYSAEASLSSSRTYHVKGLGVLRLRTSKLIIERSHSSHKIATCSQAFTHLQIIPRIFLNFNILVS